MYWANGYYHRILIKCTHSSAVKDTCCYYGEKEWQIQAEALYTLFLCHTCCVSFVTGIYFVARLGTKQVGSNHKVSDLYLGSIYSKSSPDLRLCWDFHGLLQSLQATAWILWSLPFHAFLYTTHYFNIPTKCTLCICYIYFFTKPLPHVLVRYTSSWGRTSCVCSKLSATC